MTEDPDAATIARAGAGDGQAAARLYDRHAQRIFRMAYLTLKDRSLAEDVVQETFLRLWRRAPAWSVGTPVLPWLLRVAMNLAIDRLRAVRRLDPIDEAAEIPAAVDLEREAQAREVTARVRRAIAALPDRQREAMMLTWAGDLSNAEAGRVMGVSESAMESILARARRKLKVLLQDLYDGGSS